MSGVFGQVYGDAYDSMYADKDYAAECKLIEDLFARYAHSKVRDVLDLGCGTGNHAVPLARSGYTVVGVDRSAEMLRHARAKGAGTHASFIEGDIRTLDLGRQFDAVLTMFAVLGYQTANADVIAALQTARRHLKPGGLFVYDVWYGPAVTAQRPSDRVRVIPVNGGRILRVASGQLDSGRQMCTVRFHLWRFAGDRLIAESEEVHPMRYFFPQELGLLLESAGFAPVRLGAFPAVEVDPDETTWNVLGVARAT